MAARKGPRVPLLRIVLLVVLAPFVPGTVMADSLTGAVDVGYNVSDTESRTSAGEAIRTDLKNWNQRYRLNFEKTFYPNLTLRGGGVIEKNDATTDVDGVETDSTSTRLNPFVDLALKGPVYVAGVGYNRVEEDGRDSGGGRSKLVRESRNATVGWRPVDLPTLNLSYLHADTFDPGRTIRNTTSETYQWNSRYRLARPLELSYDGAFDSQKDRLGGVESESMNHSGRFAYGDKFLKGRLSLNANYRISSTRTKTRASRGGEVTIPVQAFSGLFAVDDTPEEGELVQAPALVDGNLRGSTLARLLWGIFRGWIDGIWGSIF
jgi:hypothetical protein